MIPGLDVLGLRSGWKYLTPIVIAGIRGRYMLMVENLFDLTHVAFLHGDMGDFDAVLKAPITTSEINGGLVVKRQMRTAWTTHHDVMFGSQHRFPGESVSASITTLQGPGYVMTTDHIISWVEGESATGFLHFGMSSRMRRHDFDAMFTRFDQEVRMQDLAAAEAIEAGFAQFGELKVELMVKSDSAARMVGRTMQRLVDAEKTFVS